jgi:hypothetical protein
VISSLAYFAFMLKVQPFNTPLLNVMEVFNETCISLALPFLFLFTEQNGQVKKNYGWGLTFLTLTNIIINLGVAFGVTVKDTYVKCRDKYRKKKIKQPKKAKIYSQNSMLDNKQLLESSFKTDKSILKRDATPPEIKRHVVDVKPKRRLKSRKTMAGPVMANLLDKVNSTPVK